MRIGNGCGFWGDNLDAPIALAGHGRLHYLTLEYLAELTMSILALQKQRDPQLGYATDFLDVLERLCARSCNSQPQLKIITNAGGMNPARLCRRARALLDAPASSDRRIAIVTGDDLLPRLDQLLGAGPALRQPRHRPAAGRRACREWSAPMPISAARPSRTPCAQGASVVITGRVADAALTVGPAAHAFGWAWDDWDRLAAGTVAGHLIECGAQATGGLWCNWHADRPGRRRLSARRDRRPTARSP